MTFMLSEEMEIYHICHIGCYVGSVNCFESKIQGQADGKTHLEMFFILRTSACKKKTKKNKPRTKLKKI